MRLGVYHIVGAYDEHDVGSSEVLVDLLEVEQFVVRHVRLGEQHVHVSGHTAGHGVNGVLHVDAPLLEVVHGFPEFVLRLSNREAVTRHHDDGVGVGHNHRGTLGVNGAGRLVTRADLGGLARLSTERAERHVGQRAVHCLAHDHCQDEPGRTHERAGDDEHVVPDHEPRGGRRQARVGVEQRDDHRHVRATDGNHEEDAEQKGDRHEDREDRESRKSADPEHAHH